MQSRNFRDLLGACADDGKFLCVGIDPDITKIPEHLKSGSTRNVFNTFGRAIVDATKDIACAFKPNSAFYEMYGEEGYAALHDICTYILEVAPNIPVILDAKRADIGHTNEGYARSAFEYLKVDAITVHPYLGREALGPFISRKDKGVFVLCRTSNPESGELQDLKVDGESLYLRVAKLVSSSWNSNNNCGLVVGAPYPEELRAVRNVAPEIPILIPGIGAQGGDLAASVRQGRNSHGRGIIINASRAILYASDGKDYADCARAMAKEYDSAIRQALVESPSIV